jgi:hypothetical protein
MIPGILAICVIGAFVTTVMSAMGKCPLWVPVLLDTVALGLLVLPK